MSASPRRYRFVPHQTHLTLIDDSPRFLGLLGRYLTHLHRNSRFYRKRIEETACSLDDPLEVLNRLPATTKEDYSRILQQEALESLQSQPIVSDISSGSTADCVLRFSSPTDEMAELEITEAVFRRAGMQRGDRFVCMEVGVPEIYDFYFRAARRLGADQTTYLRITHHYSATVDPLRRLAPSILLTLPSLMIRAWPYIKTFWDRDKSPIRSFIHMGEPIHPALRQEIMDELGCDVYSFYGTTELGGIGGECRHGCGCHFDPALVCPTLETPREVEPGVYEGEALFTSLHFRHQSVLKYRVGDIVRLTLSPCACGEDTPRLSFVERTNDSFIITGDKFRYMTIFTALQQVIPTLTHVSITLSDMPDDEGNTLMTISLPDTVAPLGKEALSVLKYDIFELNTIYQYGLVKFQLQFLPPNEFGERKMKRVVDLRKYFT